ncbi:hypothetical protein BH09ACT1_BH09ACT1_18090 [soil metagenome]
MAAVTRMDPRAERSDGALRAAILELAARANVGLISVTELCRQAGISRGTFYNHAQNHGYLPTPAGLLARVLTQDLDFIRERMERDFESRTALGVVVRTSLELLLDHVVSRWAVYRRGLSEDASPELLMLLVTHFEVSVRQFMARSRRSLPGITVDSSPERRAEAENILSSAVAHSYVGVIRGWLREDTRDDLDFVLGLWFASTPRWMLG